MSLACPIGPEANILEPNPQQCHRLWLENPILSLHDMETIKLTKHLNWKSKIIDITYEYNEETTVLKDAIDKICVQAEQAAKDGYQFLILSDRNVDSKHVPVSTVLACGAVHHHLIMTRLRSKCGIILETGLRTRGKSLLESWDTTFLPN